MNYLLFYKGDYGTSLRGPEMRYIALAEEIIKLGCSVTIVTEKAIPSLFCRSIQFVLLGKVFDVVKVFFRSDIIVLHGGGPVILLMSSLMAFLGKSVVLDGYVPHWIELDEQARKMDMFSPKLAFKSMFNAFRSLFGVFVFDHIVVANQRQLDLMRGISAPFFRTDEFHKVHVIPFGCEAYTPRSRVNGISLLNELDKKAGSLNESDFLVGWLGGVYGWFDINQLLIAVLPALSQNKSIKLVFFGVSEQKQISMLSCLPADLASNIIFLPWVPFAKRLDYWAGFDLSLVWGAEGYENDYASRTRNFDCLSLGLPILQNKDDEWSGRLHDAFAGIVTTHNELSADLLAISQDSHRLEKLKQGMVNLAPEFYWGKFAEKLVSITKNKPISLVRRLSGFFAIAMVSPVVMILFLLSFLSQQRSKQSS